MHGSVEIPGWKIEVSESRFVQSVSRQFISDEFQTVFVPIPRNASTSVQRALGMPLRGGHPFPEWFKRFYQREWDEYRSFAVVRSPYERIRSAIGFARTGGGEWLRGGAKHPDADFADMPAVDILRAVREGGGKHEGWLPQSLWVYGYDGKVAVDDLVPWPDLGKYMTTTFRVQLPYLNMGAPYRAGMTDDAWELFEEMYSSDIQLWHELTGERK